MLKNLEDSAIAFLNLSPDCILVADASGHIVATNQVVKELFGYEPEELASQPIEMIMPERFQHGHASKWAAYIKNPAERKFGARKNLFARRKNGQEFPIDISIKPMQIKDQVFIVATMRDVSDHYELYSDAKRAELMIKSHFPACVHELDLNGVFLSMNPAGLKMLGFDHEAQVVGESIFMFSDQSQYDDIERSLEKAREGLSSTLYFTSHSQKHPIRHFKSHFIPMVDSNGKPKKILGVTEDITTHFEATQNLIAEKQQFQALTDLAPVGIFKLDADGRCLFTNQAWSQITGIEQAEAYENGWLQGIHPDDKTRIFASWHAFAASTESRYSEEFRIFTPLAEEKWVWGLACRTHAAGLQNQSDFLGVFYDITENKKAQKTLVESEASLLAAKQKSKFISQLSHEIRTPVSCISGYCELLRDDPVSETERQQYLEVIADNSKHLLSLIEGILQLSKIETGQMTFQKEALHLPTLLKELQWMFRMEVEKKGLKLKLGIDDGICKDIFTDATRLKQILTNLVGNSLKFTEQGEISIHVSMAAHSSPDAPVLDIRITDTGCGISKENLPLVFDNYNRGDRTQQGNGLGLTISREIARCMGGDITIAWSRLNEGTCFLFTLPVEFVSSG